VALQVSSALARAHQMGVIHRDLKPENVMLVPGPGDTEEVVKLTDFGIAKVVDAPALTFTETMFGTPGYIAPEYVEGIPADGRADLYSLGVVLYEMITKQLPYEARAQADLLLAPLTAAPIPASTRVAGLPADLDALLLRMLARRAEDRPVDAFEVFETLNDVLRRFAGGSMRPGSVPKPGDEHTEVDSTKAGVPPARGSIPTLTDEAEGQGAPQGNVTREVAQFPTIEIASRWHTAIAEIDAAIARARKRGGRHVRSADHAAQLLETARGMVANIERASARVAEHQARTDRFEARGRAFRANLGYAIDSLVRDRSRERAHSAAIASRREALNQGGAPSQAGGETLVWEAAALAAEEDRARTVDEDLTFQIDALQKQLDAENEALDGELVEAKGSLEGSLAALRLLTSEIVRTLDDAAAAVTGGRR
jgi:serine/threonine-protein kinase